MSWQLPNKQRSKALPGFVRTTSVHAYIPSMELLLAVRILRLFGFALRLQTIGRKRLIVSYYTLATPYYEGTSTEHCPSQNVTSLVPFRTLEPCQDLFQSFQGLSI